MTRRVNRQNTLPSSLFPLPAKATRAALFAATILAGGATAGAAQFPPGPEFAPGNQGSRNLHVVAHVPLGRMFTVGDIEIEQELSRPYAYVPRMQGTTKSGGFSIISLKDQARARAIYTWRIEEAELHQGHGGMQNKYFKLRNRYYDVQSFQFGQNGPDADVGAIVFDVTGLPDTTQVKEIGRIRTPDTRNGFHNIFTYKHSDGRALLFTTIFGPFANIYDMDRFVSGSASTSLVGRVPHPNPRSPTGLGYHDFYVGYDPAARQDKFYGPGINGYYVFDVTRPDQPKLLTSITGYAGVYWAHTFTPTPDGRYAVTEDEYQHAPLRIFDLKPGLDGQVKTISRPIGAWTADWKNLVHNHEVRWPYVFVSGYEDGLQVFNMMDPTNPYTVGWYDTFEGPHDRGYGGPAKPEAGDGITNGAFGVDVRNADGLIVISDMTTGFWAFRMDGFDGWNGHQWGMPNISSAQDWDDGPDGAPKPARVS